MPDATEQDFIRLASSESPSFVLEMANRALAAKPDDAIALAAKGVALGRLGEPADGVNALVEACQAASDDLGVWANVTTLAQQAGMDERLLAALDEHSQRGDGIPNPWQLLGLAHRFLGHPDAAVDALARAASADASNQVVWLELGHAAVDAERPEQSLLAMDKLVELEADAAGVPLVASFRAISLARLARVDEALTALEALRDADLTNAGIYAGLAYLSVTQALVDAGRNQEALNLLDHAAKSVPEWRPGGRSLWLLGRALTGLGRFDEAVAAYQAADALAADDASRALIRVGHALAHEQSGRLADALAVLDQATGLSMSPVDSAGAALVRGRLLNALARPADALAILDRIDERVLSPDLLPELLLHRGIALSTTGRQPEALLQLAKAQRLDVPAPLAPSILFWEGMVLVQLNRPDEALPNLDKAVALTGTDRAPVELLAARARVLSRLAKHAEAFDAYKVAYEHFTDPATRAAVTPEIAVAAETAGRNDDALAFADIALRELPAVAQNADARLRALGVRARALKNMGQTQAALEAFEQAAALAPSLRNDLSFLNSEWETLIGAQRYQEALALLDAATNEGRSIVRHPLMILARGDTVRRMEDRVDSYFAAAREASVVNAEFERDARAWLFAGMARNISQRYAEAHDAFQKYRELDPSSARVPLIVAYDGIALAGMERFNDALVMLNGLPAALPAPLAVVSEMARAQAHVGLEQWDQAMAAFDRAFAAGNGARDVDPSVVASVLAGKANCLARRERHDEALPLLDDASKRLDAAGANSGIARIAVLTSKAFSLHRLKRTDEALALLDGTAAIVETLPKELPFRGLPWWFKAIVLSDLDRDDEAVRACERADREGMPGNHALTVAGSALLVLEDYDHALETFESAFRKAGDDDQRFEALSGKGRALHRRQDHARAVDAYRAAMDLECRAARTDWLVWQRLGESYDALDRPRAALRAYRRGWALDKRPKRSRDLALGLSAALLNLGQPREALEFLDKAQKVTDPDARLTYNRGLALLRLKDTDGARKALRKTADQGIDAAGDLLKKLERRLATQTAWTESWFGQATGWGKRVLGAVLLVIVGIVLVAPLVTYRVSGILDWKTLVAPPIVALVLLLLPSMRNVSVSLGDLKLEAEPSSASAADEVPESALLATVPMLSGSVATVSSYSARAL